MIIEKGADMENKFAILIDSDNISAKYIKCIIDETNKYGVITYRRIYGDFTTNQMNPWKNTLSEHSITPIQQFQNTKGKNSSDSALIIDAMDILYTGNVDGFCLVSSDSDFTRLASRLKEAGKIVIGMGEKKTPTSFRNACTEFKYLDILLNHTSEVTSKTELSKIIEAIYEIITTNENKGKETGLGEIGSSLIKRYSDFDVRNYGYSSLSKFIESTKQFELSRNNTTINVVMKTGNDIKEIRDKVFEILARKKNKSGILLGRLAQELYQCIPNFNPKKFGYSTFLKFLQDIDGVQIKSKEKQKYAITKK
ncbi:MAG: NYN domain-containing protein [Eubacterium sp.]|nr:NYN domain-containing protein [Eubacterium sp.]